MYKLILLIIPTLFSFHIKCQTIRGIVKEKNNKIIEGVNIKTSLNQGTISNSNGEYDILLPANKSTIITFSYVGYKSEKIRIPGLKKNQNYELNITLDSINFLLVWHS